MIEWCQAFLNAEARARAGDPGHVPLRRLNNAEYDATVRELTGVNLRPTREFPADGAAGEGFANAAEALDAATEAAADAEAAMRSTVDTARLAGNQPFRTILSAISTLSLKGGG